MYFSILDAGKKKVADNDDYSDLLLPYLLRQQEQGSKLSFSDGELAFMGGSVLDAAIDTTLATFETLMMCLIAHNDFMMRVLTEIDNVCGEQVPQTEEAKRMPFLAACMMEVLRWRGVANSGIPHCMSEDDVFEGFKIPKGTVVIASAYSIHLREQDYDKAHEYNPDRFMANPYGVNYKVSDEEGRKTSYQFGDGWRRCRGEQFAKTRMLITSAKLLWAFELRTLDGKPLDLSWETGFRSGLSNSPQGFRPTLTPRTEARARAVMEQHRKSEEYLEKRFGE